VSLTLILCGSRRSVIEPRSACVCFVFVVSPVRLTSHLTTPLGSTLRRSSRWVVVGPLVVHYASPASLLPSWLFILLFCSLHQCCPHCIGWVYALRLAVIELVGILSVVAGLWHICRCGGGKGGKGCVSLDLVSGRLRREG
jgi:hypothetical protein